MTVPLEPHSQPERYPPRLRATAKYSHFHPTALATSNSPHSHSSSSSPAQTPSLGAISSKTNASIILFKLAKPFKPQLVYHSTHNTSSWINLKFSHDARLLAASYDSSVLVYDCTGDALQPLLTRVSHGRGIIRCLNWKNSHDQGQGRNDLMTCSEHVVAQWDLRNPKRPSLSFTGDGFISVVSNENEMAALNSNGVVTVYDSRKNSMSAASAANDQHSSGDDDFIHKFRAHEIGVGIERLGPFWATWGIEMDESTSVKMWSPRKDEAASSTDNYWYMGDDDASSREDGKKNSELSVLKMSDSKDGSGCVAEAKVDDLTTVKILSSSQSQSQSQNSPQNGFVTISNPSMDLNGRPCDGRGLWQANLWMVSGSGSKPDSNDEDVECIASFQSGGSDDPLLTQMVGQDPGHLIAAELSCLMDSTMAQESHDGTEDKKTKENTTYTPSDGEMIVCCLSSTGYITTHAIPEASGLYVNSKRNNQDSISTKSPFRYHFGMNTNSKSTAKIYRSGGENDNNMQNLGIGRKRSKSDADKYTGGINSIEGGTMQFDLDDEYDKERDLVDAKVSNDDELVKELMDQNKPQITEAIDPEKAAKVPSPRMCGAVFGVDGRLMTFHNGNVKTMWNWYTSDYQQQSSRNSQRQDFGETGIGGQSTFQSLEDEHSVSSDGIKAASNANSSIFPHSVWDLMKMNKAAKVAQWGNERDDDGGDEQESSQGGNDSDESPEESDESSESGSEESFNDTNNSTYENYFGKSSDLVSQFDITEVVEPSSRLPKSFGGRRPRAASFVGPTANLEAKVFLTDEVQTIVMNGQCPELADKWILGPWKDLSRLKKLSAVEPDEESKAAEDIQADMSGKTFFTLQKAKSLPSAKYLRKQRPPVFNEDTNNSVWQASSPDVQRRENLVAGLQKLYYHDTKGTSSKVPLDQKVMQKGESVRFKENHGPASPRCEPHIDIITASSVMRPDRDRMNSMQNRRDICIHNAKCAAAIGQHDKADVWNLLSEMVDSVSADSYDDFDGWHNLNGSALGRELLLNILRYYELAGDIQMLATIVSVLGAGCKTGRLSSRENPSSPFELLLPEDDTRCNLYIHHYSTLLYNWGKLTTRVELNKHLTSRAVVTRNKDVFAPCCNRCNRLAIPETNVCHHCREYAFRCSICTNSVRGLFTVCVICGHGGHQSHMMSWFSKRSVCPTGCGCTCTLTTLADKEPLVHLSSERPSSPITALNEA